MGHMMKFNVFAYLILRKTKLRLFLLLVFIYSLKSVS